MGLLKTIEGVRKISFVGLAKNTGKTVALQRLLDELYDSKVIIGLTSIGHDGEEFDQINILIKKPRIFIREGSYVATTDKLFALSTARFEIVYSSEFQTPLGKILIGKIEKAGLIEIAGPSTSLGVNDISDIMLKMGAQKVLIDGSINRKAISSPLLTDGFIVATGAVMGREMDAVIDETFQAVSCIRMPVFNPVLNNINPYGVTFYGHNMEVLYSFESPILNRLYFLQAVADLKVLYIVSFRPIVESLLIEIASFLKSNNRQITVIISDYTRLFLENKSISYFEKRGINIRVMYPANLLALTVNPVAPLSHSFNSTVFVNALKSALDGIPVFDVMSPDYQ